MAEREDALPIHGHRIVPVAKHEGSVRRWRCRDCGAEADDAETYLDVDCPERR